MTQRPAISRVALWSATAALLLLASSARAAATSSPDELAEAGSMLAAAEPGFEQATALRVVDSPLTSGGQGCFDPQSWVWQAPRAERVSVDVVAASLAVEVACEIGRADCDRRPETMPDDEVVTAYEAAALTCALKRAQHESLEGDEPFDDKSCFESEMTLWTLDGEAEPPRPWERLSCSTSDPECLPMPPLPQAPSVPHAAPAADVAATAPVIVDVVTHDLTWRDGEPLAGVRRRVERPPSA